MDSTAAHWWMPPSTESSVCAATCVALVSAPFLCCQSSHPLAPFQRLGDRALPGCPVAQRSHARGCRPGGRTNWHALSARPVLGPPFSETGARLEPGAGAVGGDDYSSGGLRLQSPA